MEDEVHRAELVKCEGGLDWIQQAEAFNIRCFNFCVHTSTGERTDSLPNLTFEE